MMIYLLNYIIVFLSLCLYILVGEINDKVDICEKEYIQIRSSCFNVNML